MDGLIDAIGGLPPLVLYAAFAALVFAETGVIIGLVLPGELTLIVAGFLAYAEVLNPFLTAAVLVVAALAGDTVAYREGRRVGSGLRASRLGRWVGDRRWDAADAFLDKHGGRAVLLARFVAFARTLIPRLASMADLPYRTFVVWDLAGVVAQVGGSVLLGYLAGGSYQVVAHTLGRATGALVLLLVVIVLIVWVGRRLGRNPDPAAAVVARIGRWRPLAWLARVYVAGFRRLTDRLGAGGAIAVNVLTGSAVLLLLGAALTWLVDQVVRRSGLPVIDVILAGWVAPQRTPEVTAVAQGLVSTLRGPVLVVAVGLVGLALYPRLSAWRGDLLGVVGSVGAFIPLLVIAVAAEWVRNPVGVFSHQVTLAAASLGTMAWLWARRLPWAGTVAVWVGAVTLVVLLGSARLYLGLDWFSEVFASMLLGGLWVAVFAVAWRTRDALAAAGPAPAA